MAPQEGPSCETPAAAAAQAPAVAAAAAAAAAAATAAAATKPEAPTADAAGAATIKSEGKEASAAVAAKGDSAAAAGAAAAAAKPEGDAKDGDTPQHAKGACASGSCCSSSSPCCSQETATATAAAAATATHATEAAAAKGSINYAEQYMKAMGLSSSSSSCRGFDLAAAARARDLPSDACEEGETTGFKFPSYEDFLREDKQQERETAAKETANTTQDGGDTNGRLDDAFNAFMNELERIPTSNAKSKRLGFRV